MYLLHEFKLSTFFFQDEPHPKKITVKSQFNEHFGYGTSTGGVGISEKFVAVKAIENLILRGVSLHFLLLCTCYYCISGVCYTKTFGQVTFITLSSYCITLVIILIDQLCNV